MALPFEILQLQSSHDLSQFDCGDSHLNDFLQKYAGQNSKKGICQTYVAVLKASPRKVVGYYSLSAAEILFQNIPTKQAKGLPKYPIPVVRIGRLGVDDSFQGQGIGKDLLLHALANIKATSQQIGVFAAIIDAKDDKAKHFYQKFGFIALLDDPLKLFLPIKSIP